MAPKPNTKPNPNPNPHEPTIKGTPIAKKENLDKAHENMAIETKTCFVFEKFLRLHGPTSKGTPRAQK